MTDPTFLASINEYLDRLSALISDNALLSEGFNDYNAEQLSNSLEKNNLFEAKHSILLKDGKTRITKIEEWKKQVNDQLKEIYKKPELSKTFEVLKKLLTKNAEALKLKDIVTSNRAIIPYLSNTKELCILLWVHIMHSLDKDFSSYADKISVFSDKVKKLYEQASAQAERWKNVVEEFNRRFKVPFTVKIANKANYLLKDEAPNLYFTYTRLAGTPEEQTADLGKDELMPSLSMGEKRAMYLLYILFDLERIKKSAISGSGKYLIVNDDIADSFDYKNKYAIIEYMNDLACSNNIDMLILTHNFDFYRTVMTRLDIIRENCFIVQKDEKELLCMSQFKYRNDFFSKVIVNTIKDGKISTDIKRKYFISSIPFYRNLFEYMLREDEYNKLTCCLHDKTNPLTTKNMNLSDVWNVIKDSFGLSDFDVTYNGPYVDTLRNIAKKVVSYAGDEVLLENKIILSIAIRLETELFLETILSKNGHTNFEATGVQTRVWSNLAKQYLSDAQTKVIDEVNLMTPESIHLNSFMYEPIIDMSDWKLKELYGEVLKLNTL